jgi:RNA polymerase I-specific transcription initiation factor RRN6
MADAQNKLKLQRAHATNALNYGQLGTATYVEHLTDWAFLRAESGRATHDQAHSVAAFPFERIGLEADAFQSSIHGQTADLETQSRTALTHNALQLVPEAFCEIIKWRQRHGTDAQSNDSSNEPTLQPSQLAFGGAAAVLNNGTSRQTIPVVAIVSGSNFEAVRILLIGKESFQTTDIHDLLQNYQLPKVAYDEEGYWIGEGDPVQQVCFAAACDFKTTQSAWMAARCRSATTIFHPLFRRTQMTFDSSATRLSPNPILRISISRTGGYPHADVAFHPHDHKILAIIDVYGNWSVWKINIPRRSVTGQVLFGAHLQSVGGLLTDMKLLSLNGDWHRICWIRRTSQESDDLLVSSRSQAALFDSFGHNLGALDLRIGGTEDGQMILDIAKSTTNPTHCYILTSTKILLMSAAENDWTDSTGQERMVMLLSWSHYRGRADLSLTMLLAETAQGKLCVRLHCGRRLMCGSNDHISYFQQ